VARQRLAEGLAAFDVGAHEFEGHEEHRVLDLLHDLFHGREHGHARAEQHGHVVEEFGQIRAFDAREALSHHAGEPGRGGAEPLDVDDHPALALQIADRRGVVGEGQLHHAPVDAPVGGAQFEPEECHGCGPCLACRPGAG
jgi:hypothetical protein